MSSFDSALIDLATYPAAKLLRPLKSLAENTVNDKSYDMFATRRKVAGKFATDIEMAVPGMLSRMERGSLHPTVTTGVEYTKQFQAMPVGGKVELYEQDVRYAAQGLPGLIESTRNALPTSLKFWLEVAFIAPVIYGLQGITNPAGSAPFLDTLTGDGKKWFADNHTFKSTNTLTVSNIPTTDLLANSAAINTLRTIARSMQNNSGFYLNLDLTEIMCSKDMTTALKQVMHSEFTPENNTNARNIALEAAPNIKIHENSLLPAQSFYTQTNAPSETKLQYVIGLEPQVDDEFIKDPRKRVYYLYTELNFQPADQGWMSMIPNRAKIS